jgi:hypothetical protein
VTDDSATGRRSGPERPDAGATKVSDLLRIYLNDQLALGIGWRELARRAARNNAGTPVGDALATVAAAIAEDVRTFERLMERLGVPRSPVKGSLAIVAERLARLKLNGRLTTYSPLSRFLELDALTIGIAGKVQLWTTLRDLAALATRVPEVDFEDLIRRAGEQRATLEPIREQAGRDAFGV